MAKIVRETVEITFSKLIKDTENNASKIVTDLILDRIAEHGESLVDSTVVVEVYREQSYEDFSESLAEYITSKPPAEADLHVDNIPNLRYDPETDEFLNTDAAPKA